MGGGVGEQPQLVPILPIPSSTVSVPSVSSLKRRRNLVKAACSRCRAGKVKCDGQRPVCTRCSKFSDAEQCTYDVDDGDTRQDALKKRNAGMAKELQSALSFIESLTTMPPAQLEMALANVRASPDVTSFLDQFRTAAPPQTSAQSEATTLASPENRPASVKRNPSDESSSTLGGLKRNSSRESSSNCSTFSCSRRDDARLTELPSGDIVPQRHLVEDTVRCFFDKSSKLFHVFSRHEIFLLIDQIYDGRDSVSNRTAIASVFSLAAVGCAYAQPGTGQELEDLLFDGAKMCLDDVVEKCPTQAAKVCCMLGMRLLFQKHRASLTFIEMGLELCRRESLDSQTKPFDRSEEQWRDGRRTWRTLFFFASWLSSSVGYLSKSNCWVDASRQRDMDIRGETSLEDLVQTAMVKVSLLKFSILRFNLDSGPLTALSMGAMSKDLERWYSELPPQMHLANVQDPSISDSLRRTVYFCHLLYLGCIIFLARRVVHSELVASSSSSWPAAPLLAPRIPDSDMLIQNAILAAQQSARILSVLQRDDGIFRRCWICIFQAYVALIVTLYALATALMARDYTRADSLADSAARCLDTLDFCRVEDDIAARFHAACVPTFTLLAGYRKFAIPDTTLELTIQQLLAMFCMPFGDGSGHEPGVQVVSAWGECEAGDTRLHDYSLVVSREQGFEAARPFHRNVVGSIAPGPAVQGLLDSLGPSAFLNDPAGQSWPNALR